MNTEPNNETIIIISSNHEPITQVEDKTIWYIIKETSFNYFFFIWHLSKHTFNEFCAITTIHGLSYVRRRQKYDR